MANKTTLIFYSFEPEAAKELAAEMRKNKKSAQLRDAAVFNNEIEECDAVIIQEDVADFYRDRLMQAYGDKVNAPLHDAIIDLANGDGVEFDPSDDMKLAPKKRGRKPKAVEAA